MNSKPIVIIGPTASGKTELALALARRLHTDVISADSRQVYQGVRVGTATPPGQWQQGIYRVQGIAYHLVNFLPPDKTFDAAAFSHQAKALSQHADKPLIFAGGTGMYLHAFFVGLDPLPAADPALRAELTAWAAQHGKEALHQRLQQLDPASAAAIPSGNLHRVMRALEITLLSHTPASALRTGKFHTQISPQKALFVYLNWDKDLLYNRIEQRTVQMIDPMRAEVQQLLQQGYAPDIAALKSLGYPQVLEWLNGRLSRPETLQQIITLTRQYAKRQRTWFNRYQNALRIDLQHPSDFDPEALAQFILLQYQA